MTLTTYFKIIEIDEVIIVMQFYYVFFLFYKCATYVYSKIDLVLKPSDIL